MYSFNVVGQHRNVMNFYWKHRNPHLMLYLGGGHVSSQAANTSEAHTVNLIMSSYEAKHQREQFFLTLIIFVSLHRQTTYNLGTIVTRKYFPCSILVFKHFMLCKGVSILACFLSIHRGDCYLLESFSFLLEIFLLLEIFPQGNL